jgi:hypothetical protein
MKKFLIFWSWVILALCISSFSSPLSAQRGTSEFKHLVGVSPFALWHGLRVKYENVLVPKLTVGGVLTGYYGGVCPGVQLAPIGRFYFKGNAPEGFYAQAKIVSGIYFDNVSVYNTDSGENVDKKYSFTSFGGGIAAGYQILWGRNDKWSVDINLGFKLVGPPKDYKLKDNETYDDGPSGYERSFDKIGTGLGWILWGPGSIVDGLVSIGYRF